MTEILIYLLDEKYDDEIRALFPEDKIRITVVDEFDALKDILQRDLFDLLMVWPAAEEDLRKVFDFTTGNNLEFLPVVSVAETKKPLQKIAEIPVAGCIEVPIPREEFFSILDAVLFDVDIQATILEGMNWQGNLREYNLLDLLQMIENGGKDAHLTVTFENKKGEVFIEAGKLFHAEFDALRGLPALKKMSYWRRGNFQVRFSPHPEDIESSIFSGNQEIFVEIAKYLSDFYQMLKGLPDLYEEIMAYPSGRARLANALQEKIWEACKYPTTIFNLLVFFEEYKETIIPELREMVDSGSIGKKHLIEVAIQQESGQKGIGKIFSSLSARLKKKQSRFPAGEEEPQNGDAEIIIPKLEVERFLPSDSERNHLKKKLEALA